MSDPLTFISLFAGIGGIDLGLERAGMRCIAQVEINDYCNHVLQKHWPNVPRFKDVRECGAHNLPSADVLAGGFPCQDISDAGKRVGITGDRSGLWAEFARIIGELRPRYVLVENVAALLHRGFGRVLGDLAALRYDAEWHCIPAAAVGAPHYRDRVFIVAYTDHSERRPQTQGRHVANRDDARWKEAPSRFAVCSTERSARPMADADSRYGNGRCSALQVGRIPITVGITAARHAARIQWSVEPGISLLAHGVSNRVEQLNGYGNAVVPQVVEFVGRAIVAHSEASLQEVTQS